MIIEFDKKYKQIIKKDVLNYLRKTILISKDEIDSVEIAMGTAFLILDDAIWTEIFCPLYHNIFEKYNI